MGTVLSGLSLLMALALAGLLIALSRGDARRIAATSAARRGSGSRGRAPRRTGGYTQLIYAFNATIASALFLVTGLIGYRVGRHSRFVAGSPWADGIIWWQVWAGLAVACIAAYLWRRGLRDIRSNVYIPELAGHDAAAPPARRIERR